MSFYTSSVYAEHYLGIRWPRAIWAEVLKQAVRDIVAGPPEFELKGLTVDERMKVYADLRAAAESWIADDANEPRRFVWVCEQLGIEPDAVRREIVNRRALS